MDTEEKMQINPEIFTAIVGIVGGLFGSLVTYWQQRKKLQADARTEAEKADDIIFLRLQQELTRRDSRIDTLDERLRKESECRAKLEAELGEVRRLFDSERTRRQELQTILSTERALRISLEKRVAEQGKKIRSQADQIKALQSENGNLHTQNAALARRLDTQELKRN